MCRSIHISIVHTGAVAQCQLASMSERLADVILVTPSHYLVSLSFFTFTFVIIFYLPNDNLERERERNDGCVEEMQSFTTDRFVKVCPGHDIFSNTNGYKSNLIEQLWSRVSFFNSQSTFVPVVVDYFLVAMALFPRYLCVSFSFLFDRLTSTMQTNNRIIFFAALSIFRGNNKARALFVIELSR